MREAKRVSKPDCVLVISAPDKQVPARAHAEVERFTSPSSRTFWSIISSTCAYID